MSYLEDEFLVWLRQHRDIPKPVRELVFAPPRKWRFDFAWPDQRVAIEIEGGVWQKKSRHRTASGFLNDCEKYETALLLGWTLYRVPGVWVCEGQRRIWRPQVMTTLRFLLGVDGSG